MLFSEPFGLMTSQRTRPAAFVPAADVAVSDDEIPLTMDLPGSRPRRCRSSCATRS